MAVARADVKFGSLVKDEAICWTKICGKRSVENGASWSVSWTTVCLAAGLGSPGDWTRSKTALGVKDLLLVIEGELGRTKAGFGCPWEVEQFGDSIFGSVGQRWLCCPSYVATKRAGSSTLLCTCSHEQKSSILVSGPDSDGSDKFINKSTGCRYRRWHDQHDGSCYGHKSMIYKNDHMSRTNARHTWEREARIQRSLVRFSPLIEHFLSFYPHFSLITI